ncbi:hypothetical protein IQ07DRAFT_417249 [Pyrenochaeta sp. DS3sAY3a]|nr:hypothetical protein IQ07DRAFT_417249 [Pyrenochaeta sp. DS3sAY3a]
MRILRLGSVAVHAVNAAHPVWAFSSDPCLKSLLVYVLHVPEAHVLRNSKLHVLRASQRSVSCMWNKRSCGAGCGLLVGAGHCTVCGSVPRGRLPLLASQGSNPCKEVKRETVFESSCSFFLSSSLRGCPPPGPFKGSCAGST